MVLSPAARVVLTWIGEGIVGGLAFGTLVLFVSPSPVRDAVLVLIWPLVIIAGTMIAWRWLGRPTSPTRDRAYVALTEVVEAGEALAGRMRAITAPQADEAERGAWKVRTGDWVAEAIRVLGEVAPTRQSAFTADILWGDTTRRDKSVWIADELVDIELQIERVRQIRATL